MNRLFDDIPRHERTPARRWRSEGRYAFLNRVDGEYWEQVRTLLEQWFTQLPDDAQRDIAGRFRSKDDTQSLAAFWELFLHQIFQRLGFSVVPHPTVRGAPTNPDYRIARNSSSMFVEAVLTDDPRNERLEDYLRGAVIDEINKITSENFFVVVDVHKQTESAPSTRRLKRNLQKWLEGLDPDLDYSPGSENELRHSFKWCESGWKVIFRPIPKKPESRGKHEGTLVGIDGPIRGKLVDDHLAFRKTLSRKTGRYGDLEAPYVVALKSSRWSTSEYQFRRALFGIAPDSPRMTRCGRLQPGLDKSLHGFFISDQGPQHSDVSAVLTATGVYPWSAPRCWLALWLNPWANYPIAPESFPFETIRANLATGELEWVPAKRSMAEILGLSPEWPSGEPFEDA